MSMCSLPHLVQLTRLKQTIERSYQTHSHNIHFRITGLVRKFFKEKLSSSRIHCCHIILSTEFKLSFFVMQSSAPGLKKKKKKTFYVTKSKELKKKFFFPFLLENFRPLSSLSLKSLRTLSPPWESQTSYQPT